MERHADSLGSAAIMIITQGQTVFTYGDLKKNFRAHSMRKSFLSALYGIYLAEGKIDTATTLAELGIDDKSALTAEEKRATVADLLRARSGVYHPAASEVASMRERRPARGANPPGSFWYYNNWDFNVLGTIFRQQTGQDIFQAFLERIAVPLGMQDFSLAQTRYQLEDVSIHPSYKFRISTRDLARFGLLYLNDGRWENQQVIPAEWIRTSTRPWSLTGQKGTKGGFGLMWWVTAETSPDDEALLPERVYTASGSGGQRLTIFPEIETVVVHRMNTDIRGGPRIGSSTYDRFLTQIMRARRD